LKLAENEQVDRSERARVEANLSFRPIVISADCDVGQLSFSANRSKP
jgi:hypothetical protein